MFIGVGKSDVRTDGQSVRAGTAAVNVKGDTQRTAAGSKDSAIDLHVTITISAPTYPMCLQAATFHPSNSNSSPHALTMTP